jgi:hypothetical protein
MYPAAYDDGHSQQSLLQYSLHTQLSDETIDDDENNESTRFGFPPALFLAPPCNIA